MALLVVLAILVLLTALAFAVFLVSASERQSSSLFAGSVETRFLADTSVNLCITQINNTTNQTNHT